MIEKVLSLTQPWAWLVVNGHKPLENRTWRSNFRGEFLVHASKRMTAADYDTAIEFAREFAPEVVVPAAKDLERGGIVGQARVVAVLPPCARDSRSLFPTSCTHAWHMPCQYGYVLADAAPIPFIPCSGRLGFFRVPAGVRGRVAEALGALVARGAA